MGWDGMGVKRQREREWVDNRNEGGGERAPGSEDAISFFDASE